jgi:hypothetical protein
MHRAPSGLTDSDNAVYLRVLPPIMTMTGVFAVDVTGSSLTMSDWVVSTRLGGRRRYWGHQNQSFESVDHATKSRRFEKFVRGK